MPEKPSQPSNPIVFLDIRIGKLDVGRFIIELRSDVCPKTCENFRSLCTGENEKGLCYRGSKFHKVIKLCHAQGGDIKNYDGTSGQSIYGKCFEDENFILKHDPGVVSMANFGDPHTNNSQFFITSVECLHLDGTNVVFGKILKGLSMIGEMESISSDDGTTKKPIEITNCGELKDNDDWGYCDNDGTPDKLPPFPADWERSESQFSIKEKLKVLSSIKESGNFFYRTGGFVKSARKYLKATRYYNFFKDQTADESEKETLDTFQLTNLTNLAATELKLGDFKDVTFSCNSVIKIDRNNVKAFYRRGVANLELKNYENALDDFKTAIKLAPGDRILLKEFEKAKKCLLDYRAIEKIKYKKLFQ